MTTTNFRLRILFFVQEYFNLSSRVYTLTDLSKSLKCLSTYRLSNLYTLLRKCHKIDMPLTLDYIILLVNDYASSSNFSEFVTRFYRSSVVFNGKLSSLEVLYIVNYLNLTFDESVSLMSGIDIPDTANS